VDLFASDDEEKAEVKPAMIRPVAKGGQKAAAGKAKVAAEKAKSAAEKAKKIAAKPTTEEGLLSLELIISFYKFVGLFYLRHGFWPC